MAKGENENCRVYAFKEQKYVNEEGRNYRRLTILASDSVFCERSGLSYLGTLRIFKCVPKAIRK
jgi:hypothetical protein